MPTDAYIANVNQLFGKETVYWIPQFQRQYAWNRQDQWQPLWEDILSIAERRIKGRDVRPHFMGAIVVQPQLRDDPDRPSQVMVIDGQQRLTTLQIIIRAVHQVLVQINCPDTATMIQNLFRNSRQFQETNYLKMRQSIHDDRAAFQRTMATEYHEYVGPRNPIDDALSYFKRRIVDWLNDFAIDARSTIATGIAMTITEDLHVVTISIDVEEQPHIIFETLNSRGLPLLQSDLIRNIVMWEARVVDDPEQAEILWPYDVDSWWRKVAPDGIHHLDQFLNCFLVMKKRTWPEISRTAAVFREYLNEVRDRVGSERAVWEMANQYRDVDVRYREIEQGAPGELEILRALYPGRLLLPLIMFFYMNAGREDQLILFRRLESYLVRRHLLDIDQIGPGVVINILRKCADATDKCTALIETLKQSEHVWPDDDRMVRELPYSRIKGKKAIKEKILIAIERYLNHDCYEDVKLHEIMPSQWRNSGHWPIPENQYGGDWGSLRDDAILGI